ncbi:MAG: SAM-dependent methyltransferase [Ruminococcus sp.]|nr:SAM-dependent methyltransferase [Ruminococcus sp.]
MKLDARLSACADFIDENSVVADIGTDHGYLPVYLVQNGICKRAIASDIGVSPLESAKKNIEKYQLSDKIEAVLSDGLKNVPADGVSHIVIAGMGGETICSILDSCQWVKNCVLVLQPMTRSELVRGWLFDNGFEISAEKAIIDEKFIYTVLKAVFTGKKNEYGQFETVVGGLDLSLPAERKYIEKKISQFEASASGKMKSRLSQEEALKDKEIADKLRKALGE